MASINAVLTAENGDDLYPETYDDYVLDSNGEALSTRLGSRSEASGVSGTSAFEKINTLSSDLADFKFTQINSTDNKEHLWLAKLGSMVFARIYVEKSLTANTPLSITIPEGYRSNVSLGTVISAINGLSDTPVNGVLIFGGAGVITYCGPTLPASVSVMWANAFAFWSVS